VEAYGSVDELNSQIGVVCAIAKKGEIRDVLTGVQASLFKLGGDLATKSTSGNVPRVSHDDVVSLEKTVDDIHDRLEQLRRFILPGGSILAAQLHVARSVCRRAERKVVALAREETINSEVIVYLNRLSSLLFDVARLANKTANVKDVEWIHD